MTYSGSTVHRLGVGALHADHVDGHAAGLQRRGAQRAGQLVRQQPHQPRARLRADPGEHDGQRRHDADATRRSSACAAATSTTTTRTPTSPTSPTTSTRRRASAWPACPPASRARSTRRTRLVRSSSTKDTTKRSFVNVDYNHNFRLGGQPHAEGRRRLPAHGQRRRPGLSRAATSTSSGTAASRSAARTSGAAPTATTPSTTAASAAPPGANIISLYVQDQWTVGNRLTLNLGLRTENEMIPSFKTDILENAIEFGMGDKIAPRLGASYDVLGDGRFKVYGSWGRYYDWTKYELARGSFGGDTWLRLLPRARHARRRQPEPEQHAGPRPVGGARRRARPPRPELRLDRPGHQADVPGQHQRRHRVSSSAATWCSAPTTCTTC